MMKTPGLLLAGLLFLTFPGSLLLAGTPGWGGLAGPKTSQSEPSQSQYSDAKFDQILRQEQRIFTDRQYHQRPLREFERNYPQRYRVVDSWFDVFWDTPNFRTMRSDGAALITFMFRDIAAFRPSGGRSPFSISDFVKVGLQRWQGSRRAYPVHGYWALQDFSASNRELVEKFMTNVASFSFHEYFHAYSRNDHSRAFTFKRIIHFLDYYKLPVICLLPGSDETILIYKVVIRDDGQAAMFYYRPRDDAFYRRANEKWMKNVIFVRMNQGRVRFFNNARYDNRSIRFYGGLDEVLIIDDVARIYREVAPMLHMSGFVADITGKGDPVRGGMALGTIVGTMFGSGDSTQKASTISSVLLGQTPATMTPSQVNKVPPPVSQTLEWPREYPIGIQDDFIPKGQTGMDYSQWENKYSQVDNYTPGQYGKETLFPNGQYPVPGSPQHPGGQLPPWVMDEKPRSFDLSAFFRFPWSNNKGGSHWHDPRIPPRDHSLPPERIYPGQKGPGQWQEPYKPPVYMPPPPQLPPHCPKPPVVLPPRPPIDIPPKPPIVIKPPTYRPPKPTYTPPKPTYRPKPPTFRPPRPPKPPKPPTFRPPNPPKPPKPPEPPRPTTPTKPTEPPWPEHCNEEYPNKSTKGHLFTGKRSGSGPGKFKLIGECYDDEYYNRFGYDEDGYDREGYDPWGEDRRGYDRQGYDPWGYDRRGEDPFGEKCHSTRLNKIRALYHRSPLRFRKRYAIGKRTGTVVRRRNRRVVWKPSDEEQRRRNRAASNRDKNPRPHGNIDKSRPSQTNEQGHVIQFTPAGGASSQDQENQQSQQSPQSPQSSQSSQSSQSQAIEQSQSTTVKNSSGQKINVPISRRKQRSYHRK